MDTFQQMKLLSEELTRVKEEKDCIKEKYENLLEIHKNLLKKCRCGGDLKSDNFEKNKEASRNSEIDKKIRNLMTQVSVLEIQLSTYKEDFQMERKDREAAQDRVIRLEQELSDLCSRGCFTKIPTISNSEGMLDQQGFELLPSSADFDYPKYETDRKLLQSKFKNDSGNEKAKSLKNIVSSIVRKHQPTRIGQEPISRQFQGQAGYEFDGQKNQEVQLRGRMFKPINDESFLIVQEFPEPGDLNPRRPSPLTLKRNSDLVNSETPSIIRVMPHSSSTSSSPKSPNRHLNDFAQTSQAERSKDDGSDEILRCPACFRAFRASTEHYKLLQHMDSCGQ